MKTKKYAFKWYKKRDRRKADWLSIGTDGILRLGRVLREKLPERIQIGFDQDQRTLAIVEDQEDGFFWPHCGAFALEDLPAELVDVGLKLPLTFRLHYNKKDIFDGLGYRFEPMQRKFQPSPAGYRAASEVMPTA